MNAIEHGKFIEFSKRPLEREQEVPQNLKQNLEAPQEEPKVEPIYRGGISQKSHNRHPQSFKT
jgi:hypothetical protein